jgi:thiamine biosynthesis lipoprotein
MLEKFTFTFYRLGCDWEIQYFACEEAVGLSGEILKHVDHFCDVFSRFDANSMLSRLNGERTLKVSGEFLRLFERADDFYKKTGGIFNPLATPAHFGYTKNFDDGVFSQPDSVAPNLNWNEIVCKGETLSLAQGQILDFGGIGKGYLIDELRPLLKACSQHFMINGGGDVWVEGGKPDGAPWYVAVETPVSGEIEHVIAKQTGAVATSGTTKRKWGEYHHLIDSRSGDPARNIPLGLTVSAASATIADVAATTLICSPVSEYHDLAQRLGVEYGYFSSGEFIHTDGLGVDSV